MRYQGAVAKIPSSLPLTVAANIPVGGIITLFASDDLSSFMRCDDEADCREFGGGCLCLLQLPRTLQPEFAAGSCGAASQYPKTSNARNQGQGKEKGDSPHLCEAPFGLFRQMGTVPFFLHEDEGVFAMRWIGVVWTAAMVAGFAGSAGGQQSGCAGCNGKTSFAHASPWAMDGAPCCSPPGYTLVPGCCEGSRHCCDNAWAGYCDHRARVESFWARVGVPKPRRCCLGGQPAASGSSCPESPVPGVRPVPDSTFTPASAAARPAPAARSARVNAVPPPATAEKRTAERSTASLWLWRF